MEKKVIKAIKSLWARNMLAAADGNFSFKDGEKTYITPSGARKCDLKEGDFVELGSSAKASSESAMHEKVYSLTPKAQVVFHAHPPAAIAFSLIWDKPFLPDNLISELILAFGKVPLAPYAKPGTLDLAHSLTPYLPDHKVIILRNHGALVWGESVEEAHNGMERLQHACEIFLSVFDKKKISFLKEDEVSYLYDKRETMGNNIL